MNDSKLTLTPADLENCCQLLAFLEISFRGSIIGGLQMDSMTNSLKKILAAFAQDKETRQL